jgi:hypothetical protein
MCVGVLCCDLIFESVFMFVWVWACGSSLCWGHDIGTPESHAIWLSEFFSRVTSMQFTALTAEFMSDVSDVWPLLMRIRDRINPQAALPVPMSAV